MHESVRDSFGKALRFVRNCGKLESTDSLPHPWEPFAEAWKDDPTFEDFLSEIKADRRRVDAEEAA